MSEFPKKALIQNLIPWLSECRRQKQPPFVSVEELKTKFHLDEREYQNLFRWFFEMKIWEPIGNEKLVITEYVEALEKRFGVQNSHIDFHLLHRFPNERAEMDLIQLVTTVFAKRRIENPSITLKALLTLGDKTSEGRLIEAVALPWFEIVRMINRDPQSMYQIDPYKWEEIIAGAYSAAGFDEVILTPRSGDKGRDVIATKNGIGSIRFVDQVKAYNPTHLVPANDVRALAGVISVDHNVSKGVITTTSDFAPKVREDPSISPLLPHRLELRSKDDLLAWLDEAARKAKSLDDKIG